MGEGEVELGQSLTGGDVAYVRILGLFHVPCRGTRKVPHFSVANSKADNGRMLSSESQPSAGGCGP